MARGGVHGTAENADLTDTTERADWVDHKLLEEISAGSVFQWFRIFEPLSR
jgi:hypothetical protein